MNKQFHIRDVNPKTHKVLTKLAEDKGLSVTQYLNRVLDDLAAQESAADTPDQIRMKEFWDAVRNLPDAKTSMSGAELVREDRDR
ncbi:hypothetical protein [Aestuariivirga litoralis]|uniref:hypothetical protein n=1 Tax=Aestuariivirga litoralis TaxID=2650924 RepID=UPI0018C7703C|nr:hypothetical protein [Aestuariivirga litoralis]MBG1231144.1 hypothetical protein [Aestuariivirga litoralis]